MSHEGMEVRLRRQAGMSPEKKEALSAFFDVQEDWYTYCAQCGERIMGTPSHIMSHGKTCDGEVS